MVMALIRFMLLVKIALYDSLGKQSTKLSSDAHLVKAMKWLSLAQNSSKDDGVSEGYHFLHGWLPSYPETTGYIIETFFDYNVIKNDQRYRTKAIRMADWLVSIQNSDGSIPDSYFKNKMVFDTGMVIFGLSRTYNETGDVKYRKAAIRAADWLIDVQEEEGSWIKFSTDDIPHTYYSRVAWSLLTAHSITGNDRYKRCCKRNIEWCLKQQDADGWFNKASFNLKNHHKPFTHTIAYTLRGILEAGMYLEEQRYIDAVTLALDNQMKNIKEDGYASGTYGKHWKAHEKFNCLTGNAQLAIIYNKAYLATGNDSYRKIAKHMNEYLRRKQELRTSNINIHGALAGSYPIWGDYIHYCYPNWATKFLAESLIVEKLVSIQEDE